VVTVDGRYVTSFRDDLTRDTLTVNFRIPPRHLSHPLQAAHPPPLPQARGGRGGPHEDAASCPATGAWTTTVLFSFRDGSTQELAAATALPSLITAHSS